VRFEHCRISFVLSEALISLQHTLSKKTGTALCHQQSRKVARMPAAYINSYTKSDDEQRGCGTKYICCNSNQQTPDTSTLVTLVQAHPRRSTLGWHPHSC
jgi:hypothetical protein